MSDDHIIVLYSEEDGGYIADIPDLVACSAFGDTPEEALAEVRKARTAWLAAASSAREPAVVADLEEAARDRESGTPGAYVDLDAI